jgi:hypothetical protein
LALPALEALHKAWTSRANKTKYYVFESALDAAVDKISEYYDKTSTSDAFILSMRELLTFTLTFSHRALRYSPPPKNEDALFY